MAKEYKAPIDVPPYNTKTWEADEKKYIADLRKWFSDQGYRGSYVGGLVYFPIADGHAVYMVASMKPTILVHVAIGDAWTIPAAHMRGLTAKDLKTGVERQRALDKFFAK